MNQLLIAVCLIVSSYPSSVLVGTLSLLYSGSSQPLTHLSSKHPSGAGWLLFSPVYRWEAAIAAGRVIRPRSRKKSVAKQGAVDQLSNPRGLTYPSQDILLVSFLFQIAELWQLTLAGIWGDFLRMQSFLGTSG